MFETAVEQSDIICVNILNLVTHIHYAVALRCLKSGFKHKHKTYASETFDFVIR